MVLVDVNIAVEADDWQIEKTGGGYYTAENALSNGTWSYNRTGTTPNSFTGKRAFFLFRGITIPQSSLILDATLTIKQMETVTPLPSFTIRAVNDSAPTNVTDYQSGTGANFNTAVITPVATFTATTTTNTDYPVDVKSLVQSLVNAFDYSSDNMMFRMAKKPVTTFTNFDAQGFEYQVAPPESIANLTINYIPTAIQFQVDAILTGLVVTTLELEAPIPPSPIDVTLLQFITPLAEGCTADFCEDFESYAIPKLPSFRDNFSGADNWADQGTKIQVNTGTQVIDFDGSSDGLIHATAFDLGAGAVSDTSWTLRFKIDVTATAFTTNNTVVNIGISDIDQTQSRTPQDAITIEYNVQNTTGLRRYVSRGQEGVITFGNSASWLTGFGLATHFVEIIRNSATSVTLNVYSDSAFTTLIGTDTFAIPSTINGLRFITVRSRDDLSSGGTLTGTIDDIEFWNGVQQGDITFQDDFTTSINWVGGIAGRTEITGGALEFTFENGGDDSITVDQTSIDDNNWLLRTKMVLDTVQNPNTGTTHGFIGVSNNILDMVDTQNAIGLRINRNSTGSATQFVAISTVTNIDATPSSEILFTTIPTVGTFFIEIKRLSITLARVSLFSDTNYIDLIESQDVPTSSSVNGLQFIKVTNRDAVAQTTPAFIGRFDNLEFYNGVSVTKTPIKERIDFEDNFVVDNWTDTGVDHGVNIATQVIDWDSDSGASVGQTTFDLETIFPNGVNPNKWGLRFRFTFGGTINGLGAGTQFAVFLTDAVAGISSESAQDHATWKVQAGLGGNPATTVFTGHVDDATQIFTGNSVNMGTDLVTAGGIGYGEMIRNGNLFTWAVYSDPDFTQLLGIGKQSVNETVDTVAVRFLKIGKRDLLAVATFDGTVDKIQFWNGDDPTEHGTRWVEVNLP